MNDINECKQARKKPAGKDQLLKTKLTTALDGFWCHQLVAILITAAATALRAVFFSDLGRGIPYLTYYPAVMLAALSGGLLPGLLATTVSALLSLFWIQEGLVSVQESMALAVFVISGVMVSIICDSLRRSKERAILAENAQRDRLKELNCLYSISNLIETGNSLDKILQGSAELMPSAWFYPEIACACVSLDGKQYRTSNYRKTDWRLSAELKVTGHPVGMIEVSYLEERPTKDEGPFLKEERRLINSIADRLGTVVNRHMADTALQESEVQHLSILKTAMDGFWLADTEGRLLEVNEAYCRMSGYSLQELLAMRIPDLESVESAADTAAHIQKIVAHGKDRFESRHRRKDGSCYDVEISCQYRRINDGSFVAFLSDITERKKAETALQESRRRYHDIVEGTTDLITKVDVNGRITFVNSASSEVFGLTPEECMGRNAFDFIALEDREATLTAFSGWLMDPTRQFVHENRQVKIDGTIRSMMWKISAEHDESGRIVGFLSIARDITARKKAEESLRLDSQIMANMAAGVCLTSVTSAAIVYVNDRFEKMFGYAAGELIGQPVSAINADVHLASAEKRREIVAEITRHGQWEGEVRNVRKDGTTFWCHMRVTAFVHSLYGHVLIAVHHDINESKLTGDELRLSEARLRLAVRSANIGLWDWDHVSGTIYFSPEWKSHIGYHDDEIPNRFEEWQNRLHPDDLARTLQTLQSYLAHPVGRHKDEFRLRHKDGTYRFISSTADVVCDANGKPVRMLGGHLDITDRKEAEISSRDRNEEWKRTFDSISDMVSVHDPQFKILRFNQAFAKTFGSKCESDSIVGKYCFDTIHVTTEPIGACPMCEALASRAVVTREIFEPKFDRYLEVTVSPVMNEKGEIVEIIHVVRDITQRKQMELDLFQARKLESVGRLASGIAHEINTPIQYIGDHARFLKDGIEDLSPLFEKYNELLVASRMGVPTVALAKDVAALQEKMDLEYFRRKAPGSVGHVLEGVQRVSTIVKAMKDFSHPGSFEMSLTQLNREIESTTIVCRNEWKYVAELQLDLDPELPPVQCLPGEINQVILNLIMNAAQAIGELQKRTAEKEITKGLIIVSTRKEGDQVRISITDSGCGIADAHKAKIFAPFFTTKEVGKGTGQGLSMAYNVIVKRHRGTIDFITEQGKGTTFNIRLPAELKIGKGGNT